MQNEIILTFSVNAYNVEETLRTTLDSIVNAGRCTERVEVLIVNDGSTDGTLLVANEYSEKYPSLIRIIDKPNGGLGSAMNAGIVNAKGKYFKSIDGDDWIESENLESFISFLDNRADDIVVADYKKCFVQTGEEILVEHFRGLIPFQSYDIERIIASIELLPYHTLFFKTSLLKNNNIMIDEGLYYVDGELEIYPLPFAKEISYFGKCLYMYRLGVSEQSVSLKSLSKNIDQLKTVYERMEAYYLKSFTPDSNLSNYVFTRVNKLFCLYIKVYLTFPIRVDNLRLIKNFIFERREKGMIGRHRRMESRIVGFFCRFPNILYIPCCMFERVMLSK